MSGDVRRIKRFLLATLLWLPICFIGWAVLASFLGYVPAKLTGAILTQAWPGLFASAEYHAPGLTLVTALVVPQAGRLGQLLFEVDPMMYGYGLPLFVALAMATPLSSGRRAAQSLLAMLVVWLVQVAGLVSAALRLVVFEAGNLGAVATRAAGLSPEMVAFAYQFTYLVLPAVLPAVLWILLNRRFIEPLGRGRAEPRPDAGGLSGD